MDNLTKKQKRHLKELTEKAYERDLTRCLGVLEKQFEAWKNGNISAWDLNNKIHEYHNEIARSLYKSYTMNNPIFTVAFGVANGALSIDEVEEGCRERVCSLSETIKK